MVAGITPPLETTSDNQFPIGLCIFAVIFITCILIGVIITAKKDKRPLEQKPHIEKIDFSSEEILLENFRTLSKEQKEDVQKYVIYLKSTKKRK